VEEDCGGGKEVDHLALGGGRKVDHWARGGELWRRKRGKLLSTWRRTVKEEEG
jgi:hypothetical protein